MLIALAQRRDGLSKRKLGVRAGLAHSSGTFGTYLARLRSNGYAEGGPDHIQITEQGLEALGHYEPLPEGRDLFEYWLRELPGGAGRMLTTLVDAYPESLSAEALGEISEVSHTSGTFGTYLSRLRSLELVEGSRDHLKASNELFE